VAHPLPDDGNVSGPVRRDRVRHLVSATGSVAGSLGTPCSCGHGKRAHEHYRAGRDCALCGCGKYQGPLRRLLHLGG
jgi:hypothetical protein